jgi:hypothetical protein
MEFNFGNTDVSPSWSILASEKLIALIDWSILTSERLFAFLIGRTLPAKEAGATNPAQEY